jgi:hypothetical protein
MNTTINRRFAAVAAAAALSLSAALLGGQAVAAEPGGTLTLTGDGIRTAPTSARTAAVKATKYKITATLSATDTIADEGAVKITGRIKGAPKYKGKLLLQQRVGDRKNWKRSGYVRVKANGKFSFKEKPNTPGVRHYRVITQLPRTKAQATSKEISLNVWQWRDLDYSRHYSTSEGLDRTDAMIGTERFYSSFRTTTAGTAGFVEFTLGRKCSTFRVGFSLDDKSVSGASGSARLSADGVEKVSKSLAIGTPAEFIDYDVTNAFRARIDLTSSATPVGFAVAADPQALCLY